MIPTIYDAPYWKQFEGHQGFYPHITDLGYRAFCDHIIDPNHSHIDPDDVKPGDIVYVGVWLLDWFVKEVHDKISSPYILVTCDVDSFIPRWNFTKLMVDPKVVAWFAKKMLFTNHPKFFQLPTGQTMHFWFHGFKNVVDIFDHFVFDKPFEKEYLMYMSHLVRNHARRDKISLLYWDKPYCLSRHVGAERTRRAPLPLYWEEVAKSKFVISPLGVNVDCARTWECYSLGSIPIVEHTYLDAMYAPLHTLFVHEWEEINEDFLNEKYDEIQSKPNHIEMAFIDYWRELIFAKKEEIRRGKVEDGLVESTNFSKSELSQISSILKKHRKRVCPLIYRGLLTNLRPFQLGKRVGYFSHILLYDNWAPFTLEYLKQYAKNQRLLHQRRVKLVNRESIDNMVESHIVSFFLDLTHFRHAFFDHFQELVDFEHNLQKYILQTYRNIKPQSILFGNMAHDGYVAEVLQRLTKAEELEFHFEGNFWYIIKS